MRRLLIRPGAIGDLVVSLPALEFLRADYTEIWTPANVVPLIGCADQVRAISSTGLDLLELGRAPAALRATLAGFDDIVSWYGATRAEFRDAVRDLPFRFFPALPSGDLHATDYYLAQAGAPLGAAPHIDVPRHDGGYRALHPYSGSVKKNWPVDRYEELSRRLPFEWCHNRFDDLGDLALWLASASVFVGNDSGITHLAAAVGTPTLAIFGPTDPKVWAPRGAQVVTGSLDEITVDEVHAAIRESHRTPRQSRP